MFDENVKDALERAWGIDVSHGGEQLFGGQESLVARVGEWVVRVGPQWRTVEDIRWCGNVARVAAREVAEAIAPVAAADGEIVVYAGDRPVTVWPFVAGVHGDDRDDSQRWQAARLLARVHRALDGHEFGPPPKRTEPAAPVPDLADPELDVWLERFQSSGLREHAVHGDFYAGNVLVSSSKIVALLDWDDATMAAPEWELAGAAWEWGDGLTTLDLAAAHRFIDEYSRAGGTATAIDDTTLRQLIRARIRSEVAYDRATKDPDIIDPEDEVYQRQQLKAFHALRP